MKNKKAGRPATGRKEGMNIKIACDVHRKLKIAAEVLKRTSADILEELADEWLETNSKMLESKFETQMMRKSS